MEEETLQQAALPVQQQEPAIDDDQKHATLVRGNPSIDTSRPFRSVKEAVAVFGERLLQANGFQNFQSQRSLSMLKPPSSPPPPPLASNAIMQQRATKDDDEKNEVALTSMLKKLEAELKDTKKELNELKERESETEIALASLNAELHKNMSKMAEAEAAAAAAAKAVLATKSSAATTIENHQMKMQRRESIMRMDNTTSLAQLLSFGEKELSYIDAVKKHEKKKKNKTMKKKPLIPILGDFFSRKKTSSTTLPNPLFATSHQMYFS